MVPSNTLQTQFIKAYEEYSDALFRYCYYRVFDREKAKDYVQEAYTRTWKYISGGKKVDNLRAFLYKTANHIIIDEVRKKKSTSLDAIMEKGYAPSIDTREMYQNQLEGKEMLKLVDSLDEKYRDVILLKYMHDLSTKEISVILNETENNVYVRLSRGFKKIKELYNTMAARQQN